MNILSKKEILCTLGPSSMNPVAGVESMASEIGIEETDIMELV